MPSTVFAQKDGFGRGTQGVMTTSGASGASESEHEAATAHDTKKASFDWENARGFSHWKPATAGNEAISPGHTTTRVLRLGISAAREQ